MMVTIERVISMLKVFLILILLVFCAIVSKAQDSEERRIGTEHDEDRLCIEWLQTKKTTILADTLGRQGAKLNAANYLIRHGCDFMGELFPVLENYFGEPDAVKGSTHENKHMRYLLFNPLEKEVQTMKWFVVQCDRNYRIQSLEIQSFSTQKTAKTKGYGKCLSWLEERKPAFLVDTFGAYGAKLSGVEYLLANDCDFIGELFPTVSYYFGEPDSKIYHRVDKFNQEVSYSMRYILFKPKSASTTGMQTLVVNCDKDYRITEFLIFTVDE